MPIKISATVITFNEAKNIKACLSSLQNVVDEIVLVDSFSSDETIAIAEQFNCSIYKNLFINFLNQKEFADSKTTNNWVLNIDADERLSTELQQSILQFKNSGDIETGAFKMNRLNYIGHIAVKCCGWYPDKKLRLYKKEAIKWAGGSVHAHPKAKSRVVVKNLTGDLIHYSYINKVDFIERQKKYAKAIAQEKFNAGKTTNLFKLYTKPVFQFFKLFVLKGGLFNREFGYFLSKGLAKERFLREQYLWYLHKERKDT